MNLKENSTNSIRKYSSNRLIEKYLYGEFSESIRFEIAFNGRKSKGMPPFPLCTRIEKYETTAIPAAFRNRIKTRTFRTETVTLDCLRFQTVRDVPADRTARLKPVIRIYRFGRDTTSKLQS